MIVFYVLVGALVVITIGGYRSGWRWTGLVDPPDDEEPNRKKTLWDWLALFIVPAVLAAGAFGINTSQAQREKREQQQREAQQDRIAKDTRQAAALSDYLREMSRLIARHKLADSGDDSLIGLATSLTLTVLRQLDNSRKGQVVQFLVDSKLVTTEAQVVDLYGANLRNANLAGAYLMEARLANADFHGAKFHGATLDGAEFEGSNLRNTDFSDAGYTDDEVPPTDFTDTCLTGADFRGAVLYEATFEDVEGHGVDFSGADLDGTDFSGARLARVTERGTTYVGAKRPETWLRPGGAKALCEETITALP